MIDWFFKRLCLVLFVLTFAWPTWCQDQVSVPYNLAHLTWNGSEGANTYTVYCGADPDDVGTFVFNVGSDITQTALSQVLPGPGVYVCYVTASNLAGESGPSELTAPFVLTPSISIPEPPSEPTVIAVGASSGSE